MQLNPTTGFLPPQQTSEDVVKTKTNGVIVVLLGCGDVLKKKCLSWDYANNELKFPRIKHG